MSRKGFLSNLLSWLRGSPKQPPVAPAVSEPANDGANPQFGPIWNFYFKTKIPDECAAKTVDGVSLARLDRDVRQSCRAWCEEGVELNDENLALAEKCQHELERIVPQLSKEDRWYVEPMEYLTRDVVRGQRAIRQYVTNLHHTGLSEALMAICLRKPPHPIFASATDPPPVFDDFIDEEIVRVFEADGRSKFTPLWSEYHRIVGCLIRDGQTTFVDCTGEGTGLGAGDTEIETIAVSEQGLYFWLFFRNLLDHALCVYEDDDVVELRKAAESVGFLYLDEVLQLNEQYGGDYELLRKRALEIR